MMPPKLRVFIKIFLFVVWSAPLVVAQMMVLALYRGHLAYRIPHFWHMGLCRIFGLTIRVVGTPLPTTRPVMFISNHTSYLDILAMGSVLEASFVAKNDVATWPLFGFLSKLQQTAFISRSSKDALKERHSLQSYLRAGKSIILFPEGTTDDGKTILPFKSSLFSLALDHHLTNGQLLVQPFTIRVVPKPGMAGFTAADHYPWAFFDETPLMTHLVRFAEGPGCILELIFHAPIDPKSYDDRKIMSRTVQSMVVAGLETGIPQPIPTTFPAHETTAEQNSTSPQIPQQERFI